MPIDDLWYSKRGGQRTPTKRHGRGRRWRVRWIDPATGQPRAKLFDRRADAERFDAEIHADIHRGSYIDPSAGRITLAEWAETWRHDQLHDESTASFIERALRLHIVPVLGHLQLSQIRPSHLRHWIKDRLTTLSAQTVRTLYGSALRPMLHAAVLERLIAVPPFAGVKLPETPSSDGFAARPEQVHALADAMPERYRAIVYVVAGCGLRAGEAYGLTPCAVDFDSHQLHVRHQLKEVRSCPRPILDQPKTRTSLRTVELPSVVAEALTWHMEHYPPHAVEIEDRTDPQQPRTRQVELLFTTSQGAPIRRSTWAHVWRPAVAKAGLPEGFGLRDLRHYYATLLIHSGASVKTVQLAMGHATPTITLNTYVNLWPDSIGTARTIVDEALGHPVCTQNVPIAG